MSSVLSPYQHSVHIDRYSYWTNILLVVSNHACRVRFSPIEPSALKRLSFVHLHRIPAPQQTNPQAFDFTRIPDASKMRNPQKLVFLLGDPPTFGKRQKNCRLVGNPEKGRRPFRVPLQRSEESAPNRSIHKVDMSSWLP